MKVKMYPHVSEVEGQSNGIARVVEAYFKYLPQFGIELVSHDATTYDLVAAHAGITGPECDVSHCHGLYWTADYNANEWEWRVNARVIEACRSARQITVPSAWVAESFQRDMRISPHVIPHGIDWQEWQHEQENAGFVLWNKNRRFDVCDNSILDILVKRFPEITFVSTLRTPALDNKPFGDFPDNFKIIETGDKTPHDVMKRYVQRAGVYLSAAKETFGIGVLEAMASGAPVLGWNWGGNSQLVQHGVNGYLAKPGDIDDLSEGLNYCLKHRRVLGENGRELAKLWTWEKACAKVADIYRLAMNEEGPTVGIVIPVYNKSDEQLRRAIESCLNQTYKPVQVTVVNDGSSNDEEIRKCVASFRNTDILYIGHQSNQGVAYARNNGISHTTSKYITCVDADDWLEPTFLEACIKELKQDRSLGITYTSLRAFNSDGSNTVSPWPGPFDPDKQLTYAKKQNQVPTACVFRREAWERVGGYKSRYCPYGAGSEDAAFWSAICSIGYNAKKATEEALFNYTAHGGNVHGNKGYAEVDWLSMYPWANDGLHPFASVAIPKRHSHPVRQYDEPIISVIIPVGPGHEKEVENALDSLEMQSFRKWEAVVVWDNPNSCEITKAYPYVRIVASSTPFSLDNPEVKFYGNGAGVSRNNGARVARAPFLFFLDADDVLAQPDALQKMLDAWNDNEAIIYSDYLGKAVWNYEEAAKEFGDNLLGYNEKQQTAVFRKKAIDFNPDLAQRQPEYSGNPNTPYYHWCLISVLIPKAWHDEIGGFDETMETWEDVDYHWRQARAGHCYYRIQEPLVMYAYHKGYRREKSAVKDEYSLQQHKNMIQYIRQHYEGLETKVCNCGKRKQVQPIVTADATANSMDDTSFVLIEFDFPGSDKRSSYGQQLKSPTGQRDATGRILDYRGHSRRKGDRFLVHVKDQQSRSSMFKLVPAEVKAPEVVTEPLEAPKPLQVATAPKTAEAPQRGHKRNRVAA